MNKYKLIIVVAAVITLGIIIGLTTNYIVRKSSSEYGAKDVLGTSAVKYRIPSEAVESVKESKGAKAPISAPSQVIKEIRPVFQPVKTGEGAWEEPVKWPEGEEGAEVIELETPPLPEQSIRIVTPVTPDTTPAVSPDSPANAPMMLPAFKPVSSLTGPVPEQTKSSSGSEQAVLPVFDRSQANPASGSGNITGFVPQPSTAGPVSDQLPQQLPPFTPVVSKTGPAIKTE